MPRLGGKISFMVVLGCGCALLLPGLFVTEANDSAKMDFKTGVTRAEAELNKANTDLRKKAAEAAAVITGIERKAQAVQQSAPPASAGLEKLRSWLTLKPSKNKPGGLYWRLAEIHASLAGTNGPASPNTAMSRHVGLAKTGGRAYQVRADALKAAEQVDKDLKSAVATLWGRNDKSSAINLDNFRKDAVAGLKKVGELLGQGLEAQGKAQARHLLALAQGEVPQAALDPCSRPSFNDCSKQSDKDNLECTKLAASITRFSQCLDEADAKLNNCIREINKPLPDSCKKPPVKPPSQPPEKPQPEPDPCKTNPACAEANRQKIAHRALNDQEKALVGGSLGALFETPTGRDVLKAILPAPKKGETLKFDLEALSKARIELRAGTGKQAQKDADTATIVKDGKRYFVVVLGQEVLGAKGKEGAAAPIIGHELTHVDDYKTRKYGRSQVLLEQRGHLKQIYITRELEKAGKLCKDESPLCQEERLSLLIWKDNLAKKGKDDLERDRARFSGPFKDGFEAAVKAEGAGVRGTSRRLEVVRDANRDFDQKKIFSIDEQNVHTAYCNALWKADDDYRKANGFVLPEPDKPEPKLRPCK